MVAEKFVDLQKAVGPEITRVDLVPAFQVGGQKFYYYYMYMYVNLDRIVLFRLTALYSYIYITLFAFLVFTEGCRS